MKRWRDGKVAELVQDTVHTARRGEGRLKCDKDDDSIVRRYHSMVIGGRLRGAVQMLTNCNDGGILHPDETDVKSRRKVIEVLQETHPELVMRPDLEKEGWALFERYDKCQTTIPVDCTEEIIGVVAGKLGGGAGPGSVDAIAMKGWLLRHGRASQIMREELATRTEWLCNKSPPWTAYRAMMGAGLCALDKCPGVRPLGIDKMWRQAIAKCALSVCGEDAKAACGSTQLCAGLEASIEGALHAVRNRSEEHETMEFGE